jgi:hypothetical protein
MYHNQALCGSNQVTVRSSSNMDLFTDKISESRGVSNDNLRYGWKVLAARSGKMMIALFVVRLVSDYFNQTYSQD